MDLEGILLGEMSQTEKDKYLMIYLYVESKKPKNKPKQKQIHRYREQTGGCQKGGGGEWAKK